MADAARGRLRAVLLALTLVAALCGAVAAGQETGGGGDDGDPRWFALEGSAPPAPAGFDRSSPRATARSFFEAAEGARFEDAAAALAPVSELDASRAELARMLREVLQRRLWMRGDALPSRSDGASEPNAPGQAPAGRRSVPFGDLDLGRFPVTVGLDRFKPPDGEAVWLFNASTVRAIPRLYTRYGPGWLERRLPEWWRRESVLTLKRWELAALPAVAAGAWLVGWLVAQALRRAETLIPRRWARRGAAAARLPLALLAAAITARILVGGALGFSAVVTMVANPLLIVVMAVALVLAVLRVIDAGLEVVTRRYVGDIDDRHSRDERHLYTSIYALRRAVTLVAILGGVGAVLLELDVVGDIGLSLLASAGAATVILGIAAQTVLGNILASLQIAIAKPVRIGDSILYEGRWAYVEAIFYTYIRLRTWDERRLIVPVQYFISNPFENWSMIDPRMTETFRLVLDHDADLDAVRERFHAFAEDDPDVLPDAPLALQVLDHDAAGVHLRCHATAADPTTAWTMHIRLRERLLSWIREEHSEWWPRERIRDGAAGKAPAADR